MAWEGRTGGKDPWVPAVLELSQGIGQIVSDLCVRVCG